MLRRLNLTNTIQYNDIAIKYIRIRVTRQVEQEASLHILLSRKNADGVEASDVAVAFDDIPADNPLGLPESTDYTDATANAPYDVDYVLNSLSTMLGSEYVGTVEDDE